MAELQLAIEEDREPLTSGWDNLRTLRVLACAYRSAAEGRRVPIEEVELPE
jgi:predicted dehydrogenase